MTMFMGYAAGCDGANALTLDVRLLAQVKVSGESPWKLTHLSHPCLKLQNPHIDWTVEKISGKSTCCHAFYLQCALSPLPIHYPLTSLWHPLHVTILVKTSAEA